MRSIPLAKFTEDRNDGCEATHFGEVVNRFDFLPIVSDWGKKEESKTLGYLLADAAHRSCGQVKVADLVIRRDPYHIRP